MILLSLQSMPVTVHEPWNSARPYCVAPKSLGFRLPAVVVVALPSHLTVSGMARELASRTARIHRSGLEVAHCKVEYATDLLQI